MPDFKKNTTIPSLLRHTAHHIHTPESTFMLRKEKSIFEPITYQTALDNIDAISAYLLENNIQHADRVGLKIENCPEYVYFDQGIQQIGAINVSIYPTLSEHEVEYIVNDSGIKMLLVGNHFLLKKILKSTDNCPNLTTIITAFDDFEKIAAQHPSAKKIISLNNVLAEGRSLLTKHQDTINQRLKAITPADTSCLIYTSGTTGIPKGVILSHYNLVSNVETCLMQITAITSEDTFLSFLPLSHVFERTATYHVCLAKGSKMAFAQSLELLAKNMMEVRPNIMNVVPRLLEKIQAKAMKNGTEAGGIKAKIFLWALETGRKARMVKEQGRNLNPLMAIKLQLAEKLVFSKIKEKVGGNLRFIISGGGALPKSVGEFFANIGIVVLEGYGLTETSPVVCVTEYERQIVGTVGRVIPGVEIGIQNTDTKEIYSIQTYESFNPTFECAVGEIIVRGHCVMQGYWNKPEDTANAIDAEGWLHTGDVGKFEQGNLKITDRIKNMLVNAYGKNVYPTPVENTYLRSGKIDQLFLIGDKREYITAIIVPSREALVEKFGMADDFFNETEQWVTDPEIVNWLKEDLKKLSKDLSKFEVIKHFCIKRNPFTIDSGELTPTLKTRRKIIENKYADKIEELYLEVAEN